MPRVIVTGANGFIGRHMVPALDRRGWQVRRVVRRAGSGLLATDAVTICDLGPTTDWAEAFDGVDVVLHLAAHVHLANGLEADFRRVNVDGTRHLATEAVRSGVKRFVYVSSIKVNGETTAAAPFTESDPPAPVDAYGRSKHAAEQELRHIAAQTGLEVVIVRPPLVYGPGVGSNLRRLMWLLAHGVPLPLAAIKNCRSLIGVENLTGLLALCLDHPAAAGQTFLAADARSLSTPELLRIVAAGLGRQAHLFPVPFSALRLAANLLRRQDDLEKLCLSLEVDASKARALLGWAPSLPIEQGLNDMARFYADAVRR